MKEIEKFKNNGFFYLNSFLSRKNVKELADALVNILDTQRNQFEYQLLKSCGEFNMVRAPLIYDDSFFKFIFNREINDYINEILGDYYILSLQNGIVVEPNKEHHQSFYHRDIIYQEFTTSKPLGVNVFLCLTDFNSKTGGTIFLKGSHKKESIDLSLEESDLDIPAGSIVFFDPMVYHKAGHNISKNNRIGLNNMYTLPFIKQQFDFNKILGDKIQTSFERNVLGHTSQEFNSVEEFRKYRISKI